MTKTTRRRKLYSLKHKNENKRCFGARELDGAAFGNEHPDISLPGNIDVSVMDESQPTA